VSAHPMPLLLAGLILAQTAAAAPASAPPGAQVQETFNP